MSSQENGQVAAVTPMIRLEAVSKRYAGNKLAVDQLNLEIAAGELFAFLGPNGAGKTTTIKMITGLLRPTSGKVTVAGLSMNDNSELARRVLSYVPDQPYVYEKLTGREFLDFVRELYGLHEPEHLSYQEELIDLFEMRSYADHLTETYSHGMRQRVAFAAAFVHLPKVLVVDEPMVGLDPKSMRIVKDLFREKVRQGMTIFMSTHTLAIAEEVADRIGIFNRGRLVRLGTLNELRTEIPQQMSLEDYFLQVTAEAQS